MDMDIHDNDDYEDAVDIENIDDTGDIKDALETDTDEEMERYSALYDHIRKMMKKDEPETVLRKVLPAYTESEHEKVMEECRTGLDICKAGLEKYPRNVDLLVGAVKFALELGEEETAKGYYDILTKIPYKRRLYSHAYAAVIDFLMLHPEKNEKEIVTVVQECKKNMITDENIYIKEYEFYNSMGEPDKGIEALKTAVSTLKNASRAALILLDLHLSRGEYDEAVSIGEYALATSGIDDPKEIASVCFKTILARDARFQMAMNSGDKIGDQENVLLMLDDLYDFLINNYGNRLSHKDVELAKTKKEVLKYHRIRLDI